MQHKQEADSELPLTPTEITQKSVGAAKDTEYVELSEMEQLTLHKTLYKSYAAAPAETGAINQTLDVDASGHVPSDLLRRAELLGVSRSVWFEVSQRSVQDIQEFLRAEERTNDPCGSSSTG